MGIVVATLIVLGVIASVLANFSWDYWLAGDNALRSEVVRNLGLLAAAVIGLVVGSWRAYTAYRQTQASQRQAEAATEQARVANEQARIAQQGQITNLFSTAVEHLGSEQLPVRLGGIYALWRLAEDSSVRDLISVIGILCAFVRDPPHPPVDRPEPDTHEGGPLAAEDEANATNKLRSDVKAILDLIGDRNAPYRARLPDSHRLDLTGANLADANLRRADLTGAILADASLTGANLTGANLTRANLTGANLTRAYLMFANLTGATLEAADLSHAKLMGANLTSVHLPKANLTNARLAGADLTNAYLLAADLTNARLAGANNLTQEQLDAACIIEGGSPRSLPEGLNPPQTFCRPRTRGHGHDDDAA